MNRVRRYSLDDSVAVELVEGRFIHYDDSTATTVAGAGALPPKRFVDGQGLSFEDTFRTHPLPGTSLGPSSLRDRSGTLGCYLKLERRSQGGSSHEVLAATNHHVLCPGKLLLSIVLRPRRHAVCYHALPDTD